MSKPELSKNQDSFMLAVAEAAEKRCQEVVDSLARRGIILPEQPVGIIRGAFFNAIAEAGTTTCRRVIEGIGDTNITEVAALTGKRHRGLGDRKLWSGVAPKIGIKGQLK